MRSKQNNFLKNSQQTGPSNHSDHSDNCSIQYFHVQITIKWQI